MNKNIYLSRISDLVVGSMKSGEKKKTLVYKNIKSALQNYITGEGTPELNEESYNTILSKMLKERMKDIENAQKVGRKDVEEENLFEADIIKGLLPKTASEEEIAAYADTLVDKYEFVQKNMGAIIKDIREHFGTVDGKLVAGVVKSMLHS